MTTTSHINIWKMSLFNVDIEFMSNGYLMLNILFTDPVFFFFYTNWGMALPAMKHRYLLDKLEKDVMPAHLIIETELKHVSPLIIDTLGFYYALN